MRFAAEFEGGRVPEPDGSRLVQVVGEPLFWRRLGAATRRALLLDYDGTLAPFREDRMAAAPLEGVVPLLEKVRDCGTALSIVSGRPVKELLALLGDLRIPLVGSHGAERRGASGTLEVRRLTPGQEAFFERALEEAARRGYAERVERKPSGLAFHTRGLDAAEARRAEDDLTMHWSPGAEGVGLRCRRFSGGVELRPLDVSKAAAVEAQLLTMPRDGMIVYVGDDETDEDAFRALRGRGVGILVGPGTVGTQATGRLRNPEAVREFLAGWLQVAEAA